MTGEPRDEVTMLVGHRRDNGDVFLANNRGERVEFPPEDLVMVAGLLLDVMTHEQCQEVRDAYL